MYPLTSLTSSKSVRVTNMVARCLFPNVSEMIRELLVPVNILAKSGAPLPHPDPGDRDLVHLIALDCTHPLSFFIYP